jgi:endonuclease/exonuclease/phosphatase family metal-dependent hydrolase
MPAAFRVMTYNIHHGEGLDRQVDLSRIAEVIQRERADIVALQEVDRGVARTRRRDLPAELAALTGMSCVFSNNYDYQGGEYGNAVLTRFPILGATNLHYRMLRDGEQRGLLQLRLQVAGRELIFMNTHIDYRADDSERLLNVQEIETVAQYYAGKPVIMCGDFNDNPGSRTHRRLKQSFDDAWELAGQGRGLSYPAGGPKKRIDYVWVSKSSSLRPRSAAVISTSASDHLPVLIEFATGAVDSSPAATSILSP